MKSLLIHGSLSSVGKRKKLSSIDSLNYVFLSEELSDSTQFSSVKWWLKLRPFSFTFFPPKFQRWALLHFSLAVSYSTATFSWRPAYPSEPFSRWFPSILLAQSADPSSYPVHVGVFLLCVQLLCEHNEQEQLAISGQQSRELGLKNKVQRYRWGSYTEEK